MSMILRASLCAPADFEAHIFDEAENQAEKANAEAERKQRAAVHAHELLACEIQSVGFTRHEGENKPVAAS